MFPQLNGYNEALLRPSCEFDSRREHQKARFKTLLFTGRPVFKVKTDIEEYFYKDLQPFVHYIPVENDLSDLEQKIQWAEENYEKALEIAAKAQEYAKTNLTFESAISYLEKMILAVGKK